MILVDGGGCKMANPFHSTGSPIVDRMCRLQFTGNVSRNDVPVGKLHPERRVRQCFYDLAFGFDYVVFGHE